MKKWEYMKIFSQEGKVRYVNGEEVKNFKVKFFGGSEGVNELDFYNSIGKEGWEAVFDGLFKRELEE